MTRQGSTDFIHSIENEKLSSVTFVMDYLQLHFDGPVITLFVWPRVKFKGQELHFGQPGYRDALCDRIDRSVLTASLLDDDALVIVFEDGARFAVSLRPEDNIGSEAGHFIASAGSPLLDF
jgi:hypothetical protein